jgi:hypothetical protein
MKPFVEDNDAKRRKALEKGSLENDARLKIEAEVTRLTRDLRGSKGDEEGMQDELMKLTRYEAYLRDVMSAAAGKGEAFSDVKEVLVRFATLKATNADLQEQTATAKDHLEHMRAEVAGAQKKMRDTALVAGSAVQSLAARLDAVKAEQMELEGLAAGVDATIRKGRGVAGQTDAAIRNLAARIVATAPQNCLAVASVSGGGSKDPDAVVEADPAQGGGRPPPTTPGGAFLAAALFAISERLSDLVAIRGEYAGWKVRKFVGHTHCARA